MILEPVCPAPGAKGLLCGTPLRTLRDSRNTTVTYCPRCDAGACSECGLLSDPGNPSNHATGCEAARTR